MVKFILIFLIQVTPDGGAPGYLQTYSSSAFALGMGSALTAYYGTLDGLYFNAASVNFISQREFISSLAYPDFNFMYSYLAFGTPQEKGGVGFYFTYLGTPTIEARDINNNRTGNYSGGFSSGIGVIGKRITPKLGLGLGVRLTYNRIYSFTASGIGIGLGCLYVPNKKISLGFSLDNLIATPLKYYRLKERQPFIFRWGIGLSPLSRMHLYFDIMKSTNTSFKASVGLKADILRILEIVAGYNYNYISGGVVIKAPLFGEKLRLAYSYNIPYGRYWDIMRETNAISLSIIGGGYRVYAKSSVKNISARKPTSIVIALYYIGRYPAREWSLVIKDKSGREVRRFSGRSTPPTRISWNLRDISGQIVPDGKYYYEFTVTDVYGEKYHKKEFLVRIYK